MRLPRGEDAVIPEGKIERYCLSVTHEDGVHKARVFASALGLTSDHVEILRSALLTAARTGEALYLYEDRFGARYRIDFELRHGDRRRMVRSGWTVREPDGPPYLTTAFVLPSSHG